MSDPQQPENGGGAASQAPIDMDAWRQEMRDQDLEELVDELVETFLGDAPSRFAALRAAVESADAICIMSAAHVYKSSAAVMRAVRLAELLEQTEAAARNGDVTRPSELLPQVEMEHFAVMAQLERAGSDIDGRG